MRRNIVAAGAEMASIVFRRVRESESKLFEEHLLRLDRASRYSRFAGTLGDQSVAAYARKFDWDGDAIVGAFRNGLLIGAGEARFGKGNDSDSVEFAFSVEQPYQGFGIGKRLANRTFDLAVNRGASVAHITALSKNSRMIKLAKSKGLKVTCVEDGESAMSGRLPVADPVSLGFSLADEIIGSAERLWRLAEICVPRFGPAARAA